jgi:hypothetical protein
MDSQNDDHFWPNGKCPWPDFGSWLSSDGSVYWISGRAGSGKSTLMAYLVQEARTVKCLRLWSRGQDVHLLSFFFWRPGTEMQRNTLGLLRSMLYQLCKAVPTTVDAVMRDLGCSASTLPVWTEKGLVKAFGAAMHAVRDSWICTFVDGLDESSGDPDDLVDLLEGLQHFNRIKVCVASRPEVELHNRLSSRHLLRLQDLNGPDIRKFVDDQLSALNEANVNKQRVINVVTSRAEGVFLWAAVVSQSLLKGHKRGDDVQMLESRVQKVPQELSAMYSHLVRNIEDVHKKSLAVYLQAVQHGPDDSLAWLAAARYPEEMRSYQAFARACQRIETQVITHRAYLLEVEFTTNWSMPKFKAPAGPAFLANEMLQDRAFRGGPVKRTRSYAYDESCAVTIASEYKGIKWLHRLAYEFVFPVDGGSSPLAIDPFNPRPMKL